MELLFNFSTQDFLNILIINAFRGLANPHRENQSQSIIALS